MGSWIGTGVALHHPDRLLSLTLGGWDPVDGVETVNRTLPEPATYETVIETIQHTAPHLTAWVTPDVEPALRACWDALAQVDGAREAIATCGVPVLLWDGAEDPYHNPAEALANQFAHASFFSVPGHHISAKAIHGTEAARRIKDFLDQASR